MATRFRTDIQGLRAVAVLLILLYHAGVSRLRGGYIGVDVFFVISGFLITTHLWSEISTSGTVRFGRFYARRARRILPAAFVVLLLTVAASIIWLPPLQLPSMFEAAGATAVYVPNVLLAIQGTDYLSETAPSVFQHYWSLGVEEQFYLIWPLLIVVGLWMGRRSRVVLLCIVSTVVVVSLALCVYVTQRQQPLAFFLLPTRAWELGAGGVVALVVTSQPRWLQGRGMTVLAWLGLSSIIACGLLLNAQLAFPGYVAVLPVLGTAATILGGSGRLSSGVSPALDHKPIQFLGKISYSLYLVHWPLLVVPQEAVGLNHPLAIGVTLLLGAGAVPVAWLSYRFVEEPGRTGKFLTQARPRRTLMLVAVASVALLSLSAVGQRVARNVRLATFTDATLQAIEPSPAGTSFVPANVQPSLWAAADDNPEIYANGCHRSHSSRDASGCQVGSNPSAPLVALFGDSHAAQWYPALAALASNGVIRLDSNTKSACPSAQVDESNYPACTDWREGVVKRLNAESPSIVLLGNYATEQFVGEADRQSKWRTALKATILDLPASSQTLILADTPTARNTPAICLSAHLADATSCDLVREASLDSETRNAEVGLGAGRIDLTEYMCGPDICPSIIGNILVYRDGNHITATFSEACRSPMLEALGPFLGSVRQT